MKRRLLISTILLAGLAAPCAWAQNSDLAFLFGAYFPSASVTPSLVSASAGASLQINYAYQVFGSPKGLLYVELPVIVAHHSRTAVGAGFVETASGPMVLFTPGVRFKLPIQSRLSAYAAIGAGIGWVQGGSVTLHPVRVTGGSGVSGALDFGGGLDIRLTRLLSLRGEARDYVTRAGVGGEVGRNHLIVQAGFALHF